MQLDDLPAEISEKILLFSSAAEVGGMAQTSRKWRNLTQDDLYWKERINGELTKNPFLSPGQSYKDFYRGVYQGVFENTHYRIGFGSYLQKARKNQLSQQDINTCLSTACALGLEIWVIDLIQKGAIIGHHHLRTAANNGNLNVIELIINQINDEALNAKQKDFSGSNQRPFYQREVTLFHQATEFKNSELILKRLFSENHKIKVLPALHVAAACGDTEKLVFLLNQGSPINEKDVGKCNPLWWAIVCGQAASANILISRGADLYNIGVGENKSALMVSIWRRDINCLKLVLEKNINLAEETQKDIFHPVPLSALHKAAENNFTEGLSLLINKGLKVNNPKYDFSPLHIAAKNGSTSCLELLLRHKANIDQRGKWIDNDQDCKDDTITFSTPLGLAVERGHMDCIKLLLAVGADLNIDQERYDIHRQEHLMKHKYSILSQFINCLEPFRMSWLPSPFNRMKFELSKKEFKLTAEESPAIFNYINCLEQMLRSIKSIKDINQCDAYGYGDNILTQLLKKNFTNDTYLNNEEKFKEKIVEVFISFNINVNTANKDGETVLHIAASSGSLRLVSLLVEKGHAEISNLNKSKETPLMLAEKKGYSEIIEYLRRHELSLQQNKRLEFK